MTVVMAKVATVPTAKQISPMTPSRRPLPIATRMSRPEVPPVGVGTFPVREALALEVRGARTLGSGGDGGLSRDAATADAAAVSAEATCGDTPTGSYSVSGSAAGSSGGAASGSLQPTGSGASW